MITQKQFSPRSGFTLIELLVVVLIIGILSAVALPQYTKAVEKARMTEAFSNIKTMQDNIDLYLLENGGFPGNLTEYYDLAGTTELSGGKWDGILYETKNFTYTGYCHPNGCFIEVDEIDAQGNNKYSFIAEKENNVWKKSCYTQTNDSGRQICKSLIGQGWIYTDNDI